MGRRELPAGVRILQAGLVVNAFGNGAAAPFLIIYLHNVRGIPLPVAGLASATAAGCALLATLVAGGFGDRYGQRATMMGGLACSTVAYGLYPFVREPWHALILAAAAGAGIGTWLTMQSSLLAAMTPPDLRHLAFAWQRVAANVGLGLGGFAGGLMVTTDRPSTFTALFWLNAATFVIYSLFLARIAVPPAARRSAGGRSYRRVVADRTFIRLAAFNFAVVAAAVSLLNALLPVYAKNEAHVSERVIGALFLFNAVLIVAAQVRTARTVEGRRRTQVLAAMGGLFAVAWLLVAGVGVADGGVPGVGVGGTSLAAVALLVLAIAVFSLAECLYDAVYGPLVADLAPAELLGRYMAVSGFAWQFGFIVGPAVGALILSVQPIGVWLVAAAVCAFAAAYAIRLERDLPEPARTTPRRPTVQIGAS